MTIRERLEQQEYMLLAPNAQKAAETKGRLYPAEENEVRTGYQRTPTGLSTASPSGGSCTRRRSFSRPRETTTARA